MRVLLVDDQEANLVAYSAALEDEGYELVYAHSGEEAVAWVAGHDFAAILLDVQMPNLDGYETAKLIRGTTRAPVTPIIFVTASYPNENYTLRGYDVGAVDYLYKPFNIEILRAKVRVFVELFKAKVDIRHLVETQSELRAALKERDDALQIRNDFLSVASHELKTPLTPLQLQMQGFIQMLEAGKLTSVPIPKLRHMLKISESQVGRLARLVDQLLEVSRLNEGRLNLDLSAVDLSGLIQNVVEQFQVYLQSVGCAVVLSLQDEIVGSWDRSKLEHVFINLLTNAAKYGAEKPIEIRTERAGDYALISVRDYGIGIAPEDQGRIFERFERAVSARNFGGLGLGLFISSEFLKLHQGSIEVKSEVGQGAEFIVRIPMKAQARRIASEAEL